METEQEKYNKYLCGRQWGLKKEAVRKRANGICERCGKNPMTAVHHLTYIRKYDEPLTDLIAICDACHDFEHGRTNFDPKNRFNIFVNSNTPWTLQYCETQLKLMENDTNYNFKGEICRNDLLLVIYEPHYENCNYENFNETIEKFKKQQKSIIEEAVRLNLPIYIVLMIHNQKDVVSAFCKYKDVPKITFKRIDFEKPHFTGVFRNVIYSIICKLRNSDRYKQSFMEELNQLQHDILFESPPTPNVGFLFCGLI